MACRGGVGVAAFQRYRPEVHFKASAPGRTLSASQDALKSLPGWMVADKAPPTGGAQVQPPTVTPPKHFGPLKVGVLGGRGGGGEAGVPGTPTSPTSLGVPSHPTTHTHTHTCEHTLREESKQINQLQIPKTQESEGHW